jgi:hypothetical protein
LFIESFKKGLLVTISSTHLLEHPIHYSNPKDKLHAFADLPTNYQKDK